ncbi:amidohydrolase family protein [Chloroflexota bacterium]
MKIIDFRCRIPTPEFNYVLEAEGGEFFDRFGYTKPSSLTMESFFDILKEAGISKIVSASRDIETARGRKIPLEHIAKMQKLYPEKIIGFGGVDCLKGYGAIKDIEKAAELGLKGIMIDPNLCSVLSNDKRLYPIYARCQQLGMPIIITCVGMVNSLRYAQLLPVAEVMEDFSELTVIVGHTWPRIIDAIAMSARYPNFFFEVSGYFTYPGCEQLINALDHGLVSDHMLFASAFPVSPNLQRVVERFKEFYSKVRHPEVLEKILYGNAMRILKLDENA